MPIDYIIEEEYRGKEIKLPEYNKGTPGFESIDNRKIKLDIPQNACYLCINLLEPKPGVRECDDDFGMDPVLIYVNNKEEKIGDHDLSGIDVFSLDRRLELIFEKYH